MEGLLPKGSLVGLMRGTVQTPCYIPTATFQVPHGWLVLGASAHRTHKPGRAGDTGNPEGVLCHTGLRTGSSRVSGRVYPKYFPGSTTNVSTESWAKYGTSNPEPSLWNLPGGHAPVGTLDKGSFFLPLCTSFPFPFSSFFNPNPPSLSSRLLGESSLNPGAQGSLE